MKNNSLEPIKDFSASLLENAVNILPSLLLDGVLGTVIPGVSSTYLSFRQKRQERKIQLAIEEYKKRYMEIESRLATLEADQLNEVRETYFPIVLDYAMDEIQDAKIEFLINGFTNLLRLDEIKEDFVLTYYDTMSQLRMIDLSVLKNYYGLYEGHNFENPRNFIEKYDIDAEQYDAVRAKLVRMGLLTTMREKEEDNFYDNVLLMQKYLTEASRGSSKVKLPNFKRVSKIQQHSISKFGIEFVRFFFETYKK